MQESLEKKVLNYIHEISLVRQVWFSEPIFQVKSPNGSLNNISGYFNHETYETLSVALDNSCLQVINLPRIFEITNIDKEVLLDNLYNDIKKIFDPGTLPIFWAEDAAELKNDLEAVIDIIKFDGITLTELGKIKACAPSIYYSAFQTSLLSIKISKDLGHPKELQVASGLTGLFSNISLAGYETFDLSGLESKVTLNEMEISRIRNHPKESATIVLNLKSAHYGKDLIQIVAEAVEKHHENLDGTGYYGHYQNNIPVLSRIVRVAESYISMTSSKYKKQKYPLLALSALQQFAGSYYSPLIVHFISSYLPIDSSLNCLSHEEKMGLVRNYENLRSSLEAESAGKSSPPGYIDEIIKRSENVQGIYHDINNQVGLIVNHLSFFCEYINSKTSESNLPLLHDSSNKLMKTTDNLIFFLRNNPPLIGSGGFNLGECLNGITLEKRIPELEGNLQDITQLLATIEENIRPFNEKYGNPAFMNKTEPELFKLFYGAITSIYFLLNSISGKKELCDFHEILKPKIAQLKSHAGCNGLKVKINEMYSPGDMVVYADKTQISRVIMNIFNNALNAMDVSRSYTLDIFAEVDSGGLYCTIKNDGKIIPPDVLPKILNGYTTRKDVGGSGIGLKTSNRIMKAHGGQIYVSSSQKEGTSFVLYMPVVNNLSSPIKG